MLGGVLVAVTGPSLVQDLPWREGTFNELLSQHGLGWKGPKSHPIPPLPWPGTSPSTPNYSKPLPTWTFPDVIPHLELHP